MSYTITLQEATDGELFFELPPEVLKNLGWTEDDELEFIVHDKESFMLKKVQPSSDNND